MSFVSFWASKRQYFDAIAKGIKQMKIDMALGSNKHQKYDSIKINKESHKRFMKKHFSKKNENGFVRLTKSN